MKYYLSDMDTYPAFLPIFSYRRRFEAVPLWSSPSADLDAEYFEFQVLADENVDSSEEQENNSTRRCDICDVAVPLSYWGEHEMSTKHLAYTAIAETALERSQRLISLKSAAIPLAPPSDNTYYCSSCSCAVSVFKRSAHERSTQHLDSALHEKLIDSFSTLYKDKSNLKTVCDDIIKELEKNAIEILLNSDEQKVKHDIIHDTVSQDIMKTDAHSNGIIKKLKKNVIEARTQHPNEQPVKLVEELKSNNQKQNKQDIKKTDAHSNEIIKNLEKDAVEVLHLDEQCVKVIKESKCNNHKQTIVKTDPHLYDSNEKVINNDGAKGKPGFYYLKVSKNLDEVKCEFCNLKLPNQIESIDQHPSDANHKKNRKIYLEVNYLEEIDRNKTFCTLCQKIILIIDEFDHVNSKKHRKQKDDIFYKAGDNYTISRQQFLKENYLEDVEGRNVFCGICQETVSNINELDHAYCKKHVNQTSAFNSGLINMVEKSNQYPKIKSDNATTEVTNPEPVKLSKKLFYLFVETDNLGLILKCKICGIDFPSYEAKRHQFDYNHLRIYKDVLEYHSMVQIKKSCVCCCCREIMKKACEYNHFRSEEHCNNLFSRFRHLETHNLQKVAQELYDNYKDYGITTSTHTDFKQQNNGGLINGQEHKNKRQQILKRNFLEIVDEKYLHCVVCKITIMIHNITDHVNSKKHKNNMIKVVPVVQ